jgi:hypothetical protein
MVAPTVHHVINKYNNDRFPSKNGVVRNRGNVFCIYQRVARSQERGWGDGNRGCGSGIALELIGALYYVSGSFQALYLVWRGGVAASFGEVV